MADQDCIRFVRVQFTIGLVGHVHVVQRLPAVEGKRTASRDVNRRLEGVRAFGSCRVAGCRLAGGFVAHDRGWVPKGSIGRGGSQHDWILAM